MRKLLTILALVLVVAMCASFAVSADTLTELGSVSKDVELDYESLTADTSKVVYSVDVTWTDVSFAYDAGTTQWNPEKHDYSAAGEGAAWTDANGSVTVVNHSNADVAVTVTFNKADNGTANVAVTNGSFTLESAVDKAFADAASNVATLEATGAPTSDATIGAVVVALAAAN